MTQWSGLSAEDCAREIERLAGVRLDPKRFVAPADRLELMRFLHALADGAHEQGWRDARLDEGHSEERA